MATIEYYLNGHHIEGWDENDYDAIDIEAAASNLTDYHDGDEFMARIILSTGEERTVSLILHRQAQRAMAGRRQAPSSRRAL